MIGCSFYVFLLYYIIPLRRSQEIGNNKRKGKKKPVKDRIFTEKFQKLLTNVDNYDMLTIE